MVVKCDEEGNGKSVCIIDLLPFEMHIPGNKFCSPGTKLAERLARGEKDINPLDDACRKYNIAHTKKRFSNTFTHIRIQQIEIRENSHSLYQNFSLHAPKVMECQFPAFFLLFLTIFPFFRNTWRCPVRYRGRYGFSASNYIKVLCLPESTDHFFHFVWGEKSMSRRIRWQNFLTKTWTRGGRSRASQSWNKRFCKRSWRWMNLWTVQDFTHIMCSSATRPLLEKFGWRENCWILSRRRVKRS